MGKRFIAVAVVVASACTALHYSSTSQSSVTIAKNPYTFMSAGSATFVISPAGGSGHDILQEIKLSGCSTQWLLDTTIDSQQPVMGAHVCGFEAGSGSGSSFLGAESLSTCPSNYQFNVSFSASQPGMSMCNVVITSMPYMGSGSQQYTLVLSGSGSAASGITVTPEKIDFGQITVMTVSGQEMVTVKNIGSGSSVTITGALNAPNGGFQVTPNPTTPISVGPGSAATFQVTCTPQAPMPYSGTLSFSAGSSTGMTSLACEGSTSTVIITPTPVTFANTLVGRPPPPKRITLTGVASAMIEGVSLDSDATAAGITIVENPEGMLIGSGRDVVLAYSAAAMHEAGRLGSLSVKVSSDQVARSVAINGQALLGGVGTNPVTVDFGAVCAGDSTMKSVEVYASEAGDVVVQQLMKPAAPFDAMVVDTLPKTLSGNHTGPSVTVRATMTPTGPGEFKDVLALTSDVPNAGTTEVQLQGIALASGIAATPDVVHFGTAAPGTTTSIKQVQLTNCGTSDLSFERAQIVGANATEFTLIGANPARVLAPTESEIFMVVMQPTTGGFKQAQLVLTHSDGTTIADLDGTADGDGAGGKDRETYYACSTGRGVGLWPLALALLALRRRSSLLRIKRTG